MLTSSISQGQCKAMKLPAMLTVCLHCILSRGIFLFAGIHTKTLLVLHSIIPLYSCSEVSSSLFQFRFFSS